MCTCMCVHVCCPPPVLCYAVQGDAAFWWNLKRSGEGDMLTRHAGCPVLVGSKWGKQPYNQMYMYVCLTHCAGYVYVVKCLCSN